MFETLSIEEKTAYLAEVYKRILEHRYRYYVQNDNVLSDTEYDFLEKYYNQLAPVHGVRLMEMVDFDFKDPEAIAAGERVKAGTDHYSIWLKEMAPVWARLGKTNKQRKLEKQNEAITV